LNVNKKGLFVKLQRGLFCLAPNEQYMPDYLRERRKRERRENRWTSLHQYSRDCGR